MYKRSVELGGELVVELIGCNDLLRFCAVVCVASVTSSRINCSIEFNKVKKTTQKVLPGGCEYGEGMQVKSSSSGLNHRVCVGHANCGGRLVVAVAHRHDVQRPRSRLCSPPSLGHYGQPSSALSLAVHGNFIFCNPGLPHYRLL